MASRKFSLHRTWERQVNIGFLGATTPTIWGPFITTFEEQLRHLGWVNGGNVNIDYQWAEGQESRFTDIAQAFVNKGVDIIVTSGTAPALAAKATTLAFAQKKRTKPIPVVVAASADLVRSNLVGRAPRPNGNVAGMSNGQIDLAGTRFDKLRTIIRGMKRMAVLYNPDAPNATAELGEVRKKNRALRVRQRTRIVARPVTSVPNITSIIRALQGKVDALYVCTDAFLTTHQVAIHTAAASARLPTMHAFREYVEAGGLMSYGPDFHEIFRNAAGLVHRILRGASPGSIPIKTVKSGQLVINQNTAKAVGVKVPKRGATVIR